MGWPSRASGSAAASRTGPTRSASTSRARSPCRWPARSIDPLAGDSPFAARPRAFALLLSQDGVTYDEVLTAELGPQTEDQAFVLPEPVLARFAQLRIDSTWGDTPAQVNLGEWKVVATPGIAPATGDLDIADLVRGGHLVWDEPAWQSSVFELLTQNDTNVSAQNLEAGERQTWVVGFHQDRAAQITRLEWVPQAGSVPEQSFTSVDVAVAVDSPLGPWQSLGTWALRARSGRIGVPVHAPRANVGALPAARRARLSGLRRLLADAGSHPGVRAPDGRDVPLDPGGVGTVEPTGHLRAAGPPAHVRDGLRRSGRGRYAR